MQHPPVREDINEEPPIIPAFDLASFESYHVYPPQAVDLIGHNLVVVVGISSLLALATSQHVHP